MADQTAYQRICAEECEWCAKGLRVRTDDRYGRPYHVEIHPSGHSCDRWMDQEHICTAPTKDAVIERFAGKLERVRMEAAKLGHEPGCASRGKCIVCGSPQTCNPLDACFSISGVHQSPTCDCAHGRIQGGTK